MTGRPHDIAQPRHSRRFARARLGLIVGVVVSLVLVGCSGGDDGDETSPMGADLVRVPADAETIDAAVDLAAEGGLILISPGTYHEAVVVDKPHVTIRGADRNGVVIDGEGERAIGILGIVDGVRIQNLTTTRHTLAGVLVSGVHDAQGNVSDGAYSHEEPEERLLQRYEIRNVTSSNNGLYGVYAFHSQHGAIIDSYASGGADSGFYLGQCVDCDAVITGNVAERNAVGFENANASGGVVITGNRFSANRVGMTLTSDYQEAFVPQHDNEVVGNVVTDNLQADSPVQAEGGFGIGIGISGGQQNVIKRNLVGGNPFAGVVLTGSEDVPAKDNQIIGNRFVDNRFNVADLSTDRTPSSGTCVSAGTTLVMPEPLGAAVCPNGAAAGPGAVLPPIDVPPGVSYLDVTLPADQPGMEGALDEVPEPLPDSPERPDTASVTVPDASLLADRSSL